MLTERPGDHRCAPSDSTRTANGLASFWGGGGQQPAPVLTREALDRAFEQIREEEHRLHQHVIHPDSRSRDGWYMCDCGPIPVRGGQVDWDWGLEQLREATA